jgi:hypothetical protein
VVASTSLSHHYSPFLFLSPKLFFQYPFIATVVYYPQGQLVVARTNVPVENVIESVFSSIEFH